MASLLAGEGEAEVRAVVPVQNFRSKNRKRCEIDRKPVYSRLWEGGGTERDTCVRDFKCFRLGDFRPALLDLQSRKVDFD